MRVLVTGTSLLPSYGGPAFSVSRLATALAEAGAEVGIWAADGSAIVTPLLSADYSTLRRLDGNAARALDSFGKADILHDNGIWLLHNHSLAVLAEKHRVPRVVSTRGMLEPWAFSHKRFKKHLAWRLYQRRDLAQACCHITTSDAEARNLWQLGLGVSIVTVPNGVDVPIERPQTSGSCGGTIHGRPRTALFVGRIYPIKGLPMLIEAWARVRPKDWILRIVGPDEAGHQKELERAVNAAGLEQVVSFTGPLEYGMKQSAFFDAELFVLPTHSESFGMVVAEALAHGLPVLTTTGAPWSILPERGCGWWVDATIDGIAEGLLQATSLDPEELHTMGAKGRAFVVAEFGWKRIADRMLSTYEATLANTILCKRPSTCLSPMH